MSREIGRGRALRNALFVLVVFGLAAFALTQLASRQWRTQPTFRVRSNFASIGGLEVGQRVRIQGIDAGVVEDIQAPMSPGEPVRLVMRIDTRLRPLIRTDAMARILTEGVVGSKVVELVPGKPDALPLPDNGTISSEPLMEVNDLLAKAGRALGRVDAVASAAEKGIGEINLIAASIRKGEGSLGKLVQDEEAYRKLVALSDRGQRTLNDLEENLAALKRTWPLSRYFNDRSFFDRDRVLFHPGSERDSRTLPEAELFEPGRSVLTAPGRKKLDDVATWFKTVKRPTSEVVIAAFTDDDRDQDMAQILTQEQADAVRKYLISQHSISSIGWFSSRKVASVGFGTQVPRPLEATARDQPPRRVEIILFTPQT